MSTELVSLKALISKSSIKHLINSFAVGHIQRPVGRVDYVMYTYLECVSLPAYMQPPCILLLALPCYARDNVLRDVHQGTATARVALINFISFKQDAQSNIIAVFQAVRAAYSQLLRCGLLFSALFTSSYPPCLMLNHNTAE